MPLEQSVKYFFAAPRWYVMATVLCPDMVLHLDVETILSDGSSTFVLLVSLDFFFVTFFLTVFFVMIFSVVKLLQVIDRDCFQCIRVTRHSHNLHRE